MKGYRKYFLNKLLWFLVTFVFAFILNFVLPRLMPGDPVAVIVSRLAQGMTNSTGVQAIYEQYVELFGTNKPMLEEGLKRLTLLKEDATRLAASDLHELMRCWEIIHRIWTVESHLRHIQFRKETRYPGFYYQADHPGQDDKNWFCFVNSKYDAKAGKWDVFKKDYIKLIP